MKSLSSAYKSLVVGKQVNTLAMAFKVVLQDGRKLGFTTHTRNVIFQDEPDLVYKTAGFTPTASSKSSQMNVDNLDVDLLIDHNDINADDLEKGVWNNAKVYYFRFNWAIRPLIYNDIEKIIDGTIGEVKRMKNQFKAEFRSKSQYLQQNFINQTQSTCMAKLGDQKCKVDLTPYTFTDTVATVLNGRVLVASTLANEDAYFNYGIIEFTSGQAKGKKMEVKNWVQSSKVIELQLPLNYPVVAGDTFKIIAGCDNLKTTCINKFNNVVNFRGFSFVPGLDKISGGNI